MADGIYKQGPEASADWELSLDGATTATVARRPRQPWHLGLPAFALLGRGAAWPNGNGGAPFSGAGFSESRAAHARVSKHGTQENRIDSTVYTLMPMSASRLVHILR